MVSAVLKFVKNGEFGSSMPYASWGNNGGVRYEGAAPDDPTRLPIVEFRRVSPGFFDVTGQRLVSGRVLRPADDELPTMQLWHTSDVRIVPMQAAQAQARARRTLLAVWEPGRSTSLRRRRSRSTSTWA